VRTLGKLAAASQGAAKLEEQTAQWPHVLHAERKTARLRGALRLRQWDWPSRRPTMTCWCAPYSTARPATPWRAPQVQPRCCPRRQVNLSAMVYHSLGSLARRLPIGCSSRPSKRKSLEAVASPERADPGGDLRGPDRIEVASAGSFFGVRLDRCWAWALVQAQLRINSGFRGAGQPGQRPASRPASCIRPRPGIASSCASVPSWDEYYLQICRWSLAAARTRTPRSALRDRRPAPRRSGRLLQLVSEGIRRRPERLERPAKYCGWSTRSATRSATPHALERPPKLHAVRRDQCPALDCARAIVQAGITRGGQLGRTTMAQYSSEYYNNQHFGMV